MSGLTPIPIAEFRRLLHARGVTISSLAASVGASRASVWRALRDRAESDDLRKRLHAVTTPAEWACLLRMEHLATWNNAQRALPDDSRPWLMLSECAHCRGDRHFVPCCAAMARTVTSGLCAPCLRSHYPEFADEVLARQLVPEAAA